MSLRDCFIAASIHDAKKTRLSESGGRAWGAWGEHFRWDTEDVLSDLGLTADDQRLLNASDLTMLVKLHHRHFSEKVLGSDPLQEPLNTRIRGLDPIAFYAFLAADAIHKKLYEVADADTDRPLQAPLFLPFYARNAEGHDICWMPVELTDGVHIPGNAMLAPEAIRDEVQFRNAHALFRKFLPEFLDVLREQGKRRFASETLVDWQKRYFASFADTTYLPITSLAFHHRFVAAVFLIVEECFRAKQQEPVSPTYQIDIPIYLTTIVCPPEVLTNRLRDTSLVRKITHRLQLAIHQHFCSRPSLQSIQELGFVHPNSNPFFFYNRDALILVHSKSDHESIRTICSDVARETESILTMYVRPFTSYVDITFDGNRLKQGIHLDQTHVFDVELNDKLSIRSSIDVGETETQTFLGVPEKLARSQTATEEAHCFVCGKAVNELIPERDDQLCRRCYNLRRHYRFCEKCEVYFQVQEFDGQQPELCILCDGQAKWRETSSFLTGQSNRPKSDREKERLDPNPSENQAHYRIAYVLVKTNATIEGIQLESEARMAQFRHLRGRIERTDNRDRVVQKPPQYAKVDGLTEQDERILDTVKQLLESGEWKFGELGTALQDKKRYNLSLKNGNGVESLAEYVERGLLTGQERLAELGRMRPTGSGLFEYLQAALDISQFQDDVKAQLRETLQDVQQRQANERHNLEGYQVRLEDWSDEALDQHILYRSPTSLLLVMPESAIRLFYPKLMQFARDLHVVHRVRIATCAHNTPVWRVLRELGLKQQEDFIELPTTSDSRNRTDQRYREQKRFMQAVAEIHRLQSGANDSPMELWQQNEITRDAYQKLAHPISLESQQGTALPYQELALIVIRGSSQCIFEAGIAHNLLTFEPSSRAAPAQIHALAGVVSQLGMAVKQMDDLSALLDTLVLEIDVRSNPSRRMRTEERLPMELADQIKQQLGEFIKQQVREHGMIDAPMFAAYLRELAKLHKLPTGISTPGAN